MIIPPGVLGTFDCAHGLMTVVNKKKQPRYATAFHDELTILDTSLGDTRKPRSVASILTSQINSGALLDTISTMLFPTSV